MAESVERVVQQGVSMEAGLSGKSGEMLAKKWVKRSEQLFHKSAPVNPEAAPAREPDHDASETTPAKRAAEYRAEDTPGAKTAKKEEELLEQFRKNEKDKADRLIARNKFAQQKAEQRQKENIAPKTQRHDYVKTPEGRAKSWVAGLQDHINRAEGEAKQLQKGETNLPNNLAKP